MRIFLLVIFFAFCPIIYAQVGIGTATPADGTLLHIDDGGRNKGILIPRVQIDNLNNVDPLTGTIEVSTLVFNDAGANPHGFYYWDGAKWVLLSDASMPSDDTTLATTDLTQDAERRTYDQNGQDLVFTNGSFGINKVNPQGRLDVLGTENEDAFRFVQTNNLTSEKDVFTIEDQDVGGGSQDGSSVLKILKSGRINNGDNGFSLIELANTGGDPGNNKYWISGRTTDEDAPQWGVDLTDSDYWSTGGIQLGVTGNGNGTYNGGNFIVEKDSDTGIGTISPDASSSLDLARSDRGLLVNRVALQAANNSTNPVNNPGTGLMVYNTATSGTGVNLVTPGHYYWNGIIWERFTTKGFARRFQQTDVVRPGGNYANVPGLDNVQITAPFNGVYEVELNAYYATGEPNQRVRLPVQNSSDANAYVNYNLEVGGQGSVQLLMNNIVQAERYMTSTARYFNDNDTNQKFFAQAQASTTTILVSLNAGTTYTFRVRAREWVKYNTNQNGYFGLNSGLYVGNSGGRNDASKAVMTVKLVEIQ